MDGQDYLNQISAENRPLEIKKKSFLTSKFFIFGVAGLILFIIILIIGAILSGNKGGEKNLSYALKIHIDNTMKIISEYQPNVKSSNLRSSSASLSSVLSNTNKELDEYLAERYGLKEKEIDQKIIDEAQLNYDGLHADLFEAKINGILDRIYAHKMAYEISLIAAEEDKISKSSNNEQLKEILAKSRTSLENLYSKFSDFSETR